MPQGKQKAVTRASLAVRRAFSAGGAVFKKSKSGFEWLLIKPQGTERWQLPKGMIEKDESSKDASLREVYEETGVKGEIVEKIDDIKFFFVFKGERIFKQVTFYLMKYASGKPTVFPEAEKEVAEVKWVPTDKALEMLSFKDERGIVEKGFASLEVVE